MTTRRRGEIGRRSFLLSAASPASAPLLGGIAPPAVLERRVAALRKAGSDVAYRRYPGVGHGFGLGVGASAEKWIAHAVRFWARHIDQPGKLGEVQE